MIPFSSIVRELPATIPFVGPEAIERRLGRPFDVRIGANESAFGVSPTAAEAMRAAIGAISWYGDPEGHDLRAALAEHHGVDPEEVCLGAGIDELLGFVVRMLTEPGTPVVTSAGAYPTFNFHVSGLGARLVTVPYRDDHEDPDALAQAARDSGAPLVYFSNPDNPMGTWHDAARVRAFIDALPENVVLALDEAYMEFAPEGTDWRWRRTTRGCFASHVLQGARHGGRAHRLLCWPPGPRDRAQQDPEPLRVEPDRAGRGARLAPRPGVRRRVIAEVAAGREEYARLAESLGLVPLRSATNFVAIDVGGGAGPAPCSASWRRAECLSACPVSPPRPLHPHHRRDRLRARRPRRPPPRSPLRHRQWGLTATAQARLPLPQMGTREMDHPSWTAVIFQDKGWWIGWSAEVPGVNAQERTREELLDTLFEVLRKRSN